MHTCGGCTNTWGGLAQAHCSVCHELFSGVTAFDKHRSKGKCLDPAKMFDTNEETGEKTAVLELRTTGAVPVWAFPSEVDVAERFAKAKAS